MDSQQANTMTVPGHGAAPAVPDEAQLDAWFEVTDADPATAYTEVGAVVGRVLAALDEQGVAEADRQTRSVSLNPHYEPTTSSIDGCTASHALRLRVRRLSATSELLDALVDAAGTALRIGGFTLTSSNTSQAQAAAETAAIDDARDRAARLAEAAGVTLGAVLAVRADATGYPPTRRHAQGLGFTASSAAVPVQSGTDAVTAQVSVTFALQT